MRKLLVWSLFASGLALSLQAQALWVHASTSESAAGDEQVIHRAFVPETPPYQGEVRLILRGPAVVMQTILDSKVLGRVVAAIKKKELKRWPEGREGWLDSRLYVDALQETAKQIKQRAKADKSRTDRYLKLLVEFVLDGNQHFAAFYAPTLQRDEDHLQVMDKELLLKLEPSRGYVLENILEIALDTFHIDARGIDELLTPSPGRP